MRLKHPSRAGFCACLVASFALAAPAAPEAPAPLRDATWNSTGTLVVGAKSLRYGAEAGILVVHVADPADADPPAGDKPAPEPAAAGMSYVAYFLGARPDPARPVTFLFNGGPGSATLWLHMGAFGPKRVVTADAAHADAAPYRLADNAASLLPESDLVFIDAPGTGFGHLAGTDRHKAFWGVDQDAHAFANFIVEFLSRHGRWNSPKYVFGESYGTTRAGALSYVLATEKLVDLNGLILLSDCLNYDLGPDVPALNPAIDEPYWLNLPTYAATAWYHHRLANRPAELEPFLREVEAFAREEYVVALAAGSRLPAERRTAIATRLAAYTGLDVATVLRADLRISPAFFEQHVLGTGTAGRVDTRFAGPALDPLARDADYDPFTASIGPAYVAGYNAYARGVLGIDAGAYHPSARAEAAWDFTHRPPGADDKLTQAVNVIPDLAAAMKQNPGLRVMMNGGYFDLATPYFAAVHELTHLPVPPEIAANVETFLYPSGHMVYVHEPSLVALHANVADFIRRTRHATP